MMRALVLLAGASLAVVATPAAAKTANPAARCTAFVGRHIRPGVTITGAKHYAASPARAAAAGGAPAMPALPGRCLVEGTIDPHRGADGKAYAIGFAIGLPDAWNGRFLLQGGGGLNGNVAAPTGPVAAGERPALARGFAVISHDSGHKGAVFDSSFMGDQRAALDFAEASVRTVAVAGKAMTEAFYGKPIAHSYMTGCSTGGRESMLASQRYPELFDGIIVGAPAMRTGTSNLAIEYSTVQFNQASPRDAQGLPILAQAFSQADRKLLIDGLLKQCDALDGRADGMIFNVAGCRFRPALLQCTAAKNDSCLSSAQVGALERAFAGPKDAAGYPIYVPVPFDTGITYAGPGLAGYLPSGQPTPFGPSTKALTIDIDARLRAVEADAAQRLTDTNVWTDLDTFLGRGGKMLFFHGVSDPWFSANDSWDYWQRAAQTNGAAFADASRYYMIPGMGHCQGGNAYDRFDLLSPLVEWVENHRPPERPLASRADGSAQVPLCPHPSYPHYLGGDASKPESYECRRPAAS
jgi:feruloyl esterase